MPYRYLGASGVQISSLSLGSWLTFGAKVEQSLTNDIILTAYENGINFFDSAEAYAEGKAEIALGKAIQKYGFRRETLLVSTKIFWGGIKDQPIHPNDRGLSRKHIIEGTYHALQRLNLDYIDLIYAHRPDPNTPIEETVRAFDNLINQGRVMYWGTSEWSSEQIQEAYNIARREKLIPPTMEQPEYNMLKRNRLEKEYKPLFKNIGLGTTTWSPLKFGVLTGKYAKGIPTGSRGDTVDKNRISLYLESEEGKWASTELCAKLEEVSKEIGCSLSQLSIAWCLRNHDVSSVITGASSSEQLLHNVESIKYVDAVCAMEGEIDAILCNKPEPDLDFREV
eukprot:TRINITY_DN6567_c0_g1_i2.p1 TRINITY_DN6567_c0_g1~~TRINITY_DN6567_c0_g1_i2.p1  ORF type:complete len:338 (+),score=66.58 TRINITY_DN6567_c0_g1_i2:110-1123(+)